MDYSQLLSDPLLVIQAFWPEAELYDKQKETVYAVRDTPEVFVPAG